MFYYREVSSGEVDAEVCRKANAALVIAVADLRLYEDAKIVWIRQSSEPTEFRTVNAICGQVRWAAGLIYVNADLSPSLTVRTVYHECWHLKEHQGYMAAMGDQWRLGYEVLSEPDADAYEAKMCGDAVIEQLRREFDQMRDLLEA